MAGTEEPRCTAFVGPRRIASGTVREVALAAKSVVDKGTQSSLLIFDNTSSELVELDLRGTPDAVLHRLQDCMPSETAPQPRGPGRPRLGVVAREITLLPRHWDWLGKQPGGASVALRKLVEEARHANESKDRERSARESAYRFMAAMAGNEAGFENAVRALFAGDAERFNSLVAGWPADIRDHARRLASRGFGTQTA